MADLKSSERGTIERYIDKTSMDVSEVTYSHADSPSVVVAKEGLGIGGHPSEEEKGISYLRDELTPFYPVGEGGALSIEESGVGHRHDD